MSSVLNDHTKLNSKVWSLWQPSVNVFEWENLRCNKVHLSHISRHGLAQDPSLIF